MPCLTCGLRFASTPYKDPTNNTIRTKFCSSECYWVDSRKTAIQATTVSAPTILGAAHILVGVNQYTVIDEIDLIEVQKKYWCLDAHGYVISGNPRIYLHEFIMRPPNGFLVDHIDQNILDNRRRNLRVATIQQNHWNSKIYRTNKSGYKGVSTFRNRYRAVIKLEGKQKFLGSFVSAEEAARAYDTAARSHFGEFARVNFPLPGEQGARK